MWLLKEVMLIIRLFIWLLKEVMLIIRIFDLVVKGGHAYY